MASFSFERRTHITSFLVLALILIAPEISGQEKTLSWTPELSMRFHQVGSTAISPNGARIAYAVRQPLMEGPKSEYLSHIWMVDSEGRRATQWTRGGNSASDPQFSPDGNWLTFTTSRSSEGSVPMNQVWALPLSGGEGRQVTATEASVSTYRWSPDGSRIALLMRDPETSAEETAKEEKRDVILVDRNYKFSHLYVVALPEDQTEPVRSLRLTEGDFHVTGFSWAPDGTKIVFSHQKDPRINTARLSGDIATVTVPTASEITAMLADHEESQPEADDEIPELLVVGEVTDLVTGPGIESRPVWSHDGQWIAYVSTGDRPEPIGLGDLYVIPATGGEGRAIDTPNRSASIIGWSGDSQSLLLIESLGTRRHVISVPIDRSELHYISHGDGIVGSVSLSTDSEHMAFTYQTLDEPWDVFVSPTRTYSPTQVTNIHEDVPRPLMGRTELTSWTSTEGFEIEGLLTYPVDYQEGQNVPLILNVHGGPGGVFSQGFTGAPSIYMLQYFAQKGFAILRPNPRGSTGYGKDFRYANFQDWGFGDFRDLMAGVDHVIAMGVADANQLLLMGWSYGGYMTSWAVTQTDRFKAASMGAGLPNLVSMTTTTDIQDYLVGHMGVEFWEDYERYERHSAMYHIANVVTPTQVIHGAEDLRVPFTQGQEFYRTLDRREVPTEMIVYPRTPHSPREPKFLMDVSERILTWFINYMKSDDTTT